MHQKQFGINLLPEMKNLQSINQGTSGQEFFTTLVAVEGGDELPSNNTENEGRIGGERVCRNSNEIDQQQQYR